MSSIESKTKSPKFFFQIIKKQHSSRQKTERIIVNTNSESYLTKELYRLSCIYKEENSLVKKKRTKYKMFGAELKRKFIDIANMSNPSLVAKSFDIPLKSLKRWLRIGPIRQKGGGRKTQDPQMEKKLIEWYHECHDVNKIPLTAKMIKSKALEFSLNKDFAASKGWFEKFKKKYNLDVVRESSLKAIINE